MKSLHKTKTFAFFMMVMGMVSLVSCSSKAPAGPGLKVLTYSSLGGKGGFLESVAPSFKEATGCELRIETTLGAAQVLSYLEEPKQRAALDVVMGVDELLFERAKTYVYQGELSDLKLADRYHPLLKARLKPGFIPLDYGALSFIYRKSDFKGGVGLPSSLEDLMKPGLRKKWMVQDPRSSSPGMLFFLFSDSILKISEMRKQWVTLAPSWDSSYKMFLAGDASMVWSYLSSLAYHASKGEQDQYSYVDFKEGLPLQVEGMAILDRVGDPLKVNPCVRSWIEYVLSPAVQSVLVEKQWMMPAVRDVKVPRIFESLPEVKKTAKLTLTLESVDHLVSRFGKELAGDSF
jgi:thiamine transport system substrate-binding protein